MKKLEGSGDPGRIIEPSVPPASSTAQKRSLGEGTFFSVSLLGDLCGDVLSEAMEGERLARDANCIGRFLSVFRGNMTVSYLPGRSSRS